MVTEFGQSHYFYLRKPNSFASDKLNFSNEWSKLMNLDKLNRTITLLCPTCGNTDMESLNGAHDVSEWFKCNTCGLEISKDDLVNSNQENINANVEEVKLEAAKEVKSEIEKMLKDAFKGSSFIKVK